METRLVIKGRNEPLEGLIEQGRALVRLARRYPDELAALGFSEDATAELDLGVAKLESEDARAVERSRAPSGSIGASSSFAGPPSDEIDGALARDLVRRAAPALASVLGKMRGAAAAIDDRLATGKKASGALTAMERALENVSAKTAFGPPRAALNEPAVHATKGRVLEAMEALIDVARRAFADRPDVLAAFSLDILEAARRARASTGHGGV